MTESIRTINYATVNSAFSKQAIHYDHDDAANPILTLWRQQIYNHILRYLRPNSSILELNAGTGIDALYFAQRGHSVLATDLSDGMVQQIQTKINSSSLKS